MYKKTQDMVWGDPNTSSVNTAKLQKTYKTIKLPKGEKDMDA